MKAGNRRRVTFRHVTFVPWRAAANLSRILSLAQENIVQTRRFPRYPLVRPVTAVIMRGEVKVRKVEGRTLVISEGGLGATLPEELEIGDTVRIQMPPLAPVYAIVRSRCGQDHGFEFVHTLPAPRIPTGKQKRITGEMGKIS